MDNNKKELLKTLLQHGNYISCKLHNQDEVYRAIQELSANIVYIIGIDDNTCYLALERSALETVFPNRDVIELFRGFNGRFISILST